jgi:hypothetical protein
VTGLSVSGMVYDHKGIGEKAVLQRKEHQQTAYYKRKMTYDDPGRNPRGVSPYKDGFLAKRRM